ncbi:hypothetical protein OsJ_20111 [Oryza sativa Japonica Group]|uniref:Uncharacterized protein n=1 Tax=Oryza sativa subsp. japonica TaxID=39947 RepID=B9FRG5_ORYSJ|nr:hypothetical protein OsJ_20111 [Oryza sativa Japonica Group]
MSTLVRVLAVSHVHPDEAAVGAAWPPPNTVELSFLDSFQVARGAIQRLFFYEGDDLPPFQSIVGALQSSLAAALPVFLPLSGKLAYLPESGDVVIDYSPDAVSPGVRFVEAEYSGSVDDMRRLAGDDEHQIEAFLQLVPELEVSMLPAPLLAVQVTRPRDDNVGGGGAGGAVAVGVAIHHGVADGQSKNAHVSVYGIVTDRFVTPLPMGVDMSQQRRRTFLLNAGEIESLKQRISESDAGREQLRNRLSTYVAISSLAWTSIVRAKSLDAADKVYFMVSADCRRRLRPPADKGYFGNCVTTCVAKAISGDLSAGSDDGLAGLARAAAAIQRAIREGLEVPFGNSEPLARRRHGDDPAGEVSVVLRRALMDAFATNFRRQLVAST